MAGAETRRAERTDWRVVGLLFVAGIFAAWQFAKIALPLGDISALYGSTPEGLAWLVSIVGLVGATSGVIAGRVVSGAGPRRALLVALVAGAAISTLEAMLPGLAAMGLLRVAEGMSHLTIVIAAPISMAAAASPHDRPVAMGIWATFFGIGFAIGARLFPPVIAAVGLPGLFLAHGAGMLVLAALLAPLLPRIAPAPTHFNILRLHAETYGTLRTAMPSFGFVFYTVTYLALLTFLPGALHRPDFEVTLPIVSLFGSFGAGWLARTVAPPHIAVTGFALSAAMAVLLMFGQTWAAYVLFFAQGVVPGASFALIPWLNVADEDRARATGAIAQMGNVGTTSGPPLFALALGTGGLVAFLGLLALLSFAGALIVALLARNAVPGTEAAPGR